MLSVSDFNRNGLEVEVFNAQRVLLNELTARLNDVAHQLGEKVIGLGHVIDFHLQKRARLRVQRGFPELVRVHFAQTLVALQRQAFFTLLQHGIEQIERAEDVLRAVLAVKLGGGLVSLTQACCQRAQTTGLTGAQDRAIERARLFDTAQDTGEADAFVLRRATRPAAFVFGGNLIETLCDLDRKSVV